MKKREPVGCVVVPEPREANAPVVRAGGDERVAPAAVVVRVEPPRERVHRARRGVRVARRGDDETSSEALAISIFFSRRRIRRRFANPVVAVRAPARAQAQAHHPDDARGRRARDGAAERAHERRVGFGFGFGFGVVGVRRRRRRRSRKAGAGGGERDASHPRVRLHDDAPGEGPPTSAGIGASRLLERFFFVRARERASMTVSSRVVFWSFRRLLRTSGKSRGRRRLRDARTTRRTCGGPLVLVRLGQRRAERPRSAVSRSFALAFALVPGVHGLELAPHGVERGEASARSGPVGELGVVGDAREGDQGAERVEVARVAGFEDGAELAERRDDGVRVRGIVKRGGLLLGGVGGARLRAREELEERRAAEVRGDGAVIHRARRREGRDEGVRAVPVAVEDEAAQERELGAEPIGRRGAPSRGKSATDAGGERRGVRRRRGRRGRGGASSARGGGGRARGARSRARTRSPSRAP